MHTYQDPGIVTNLAKPNRRSDPPLPSYFHRDGKTHLLRCSKAVASAAAAPVEVRAVAMSWSRSELDEFSLLPESRGSARARVPISSRPPIRI
jgi:hypothetical protein